MNTKSAQTTLNIKRILVWIVWLSIAAIFLLAFSLQKKKEIKYGFAAIPGDCGGPSGVPDGYVDLFDYGSLSRSFGLTQGQTGFNAACDFYVDSHNIIDLFDYQILANNFGKTGNLTPSPTPFSVSCLNQAGQLITLSGSKTSYSNQTLSDFAIIDATSATFTNGGTHPVTFGGGKENCWHGGKVYGGYPLNTPWSETHSTAGITITDRTPGAIVENAYIERIGDGITNRLGEYAGQSGISQPITVRGMWFRDIRDDCIESDWQDGALIKDNLLDGCYVTFATEKRSGAGTDGSNNVWEIRNTLAYMHDQIGVYSGTSPGHSMFFKWDSTSPKIKIYDSIFRVDSDITETSYTRQFDIPRDKLLDCSNNILVWLGPGNFPGTMPSCFTITKDRTVWENAVSGWKTKYGY